VEAIKNNVKKYNDKKKNYSIYHVTKEILNMSNPK